MELKINEVKVPEEISFNYEEIKNGLVEKVSMYKTMVYTDNDIKQAKADKADLNRLKKALNDERIRREKEYMKPFTDFKNKVNDLIKIIDEPVGIIDAQVKEFEESKKREKKNSIIEYFENSRAPQWLEVEQIWGDKWLNATYSMKQIETDITEKLKEIKTNLDTIAALPEFSFEANEIYKRSLNLDSAIAEGKRLADLQKRKEAQERMEAELKAKQEAELKAKQEAEKAKLEAQASQILEEIKQTQPEAPERVQTMEEPKKKEKANWVNFSAFLTMTQALQLKEFCNQNGIQIKSIENRRA